MGLLSCFDQKVLGSTTSVAKTIYIILAILILPSSSHAGDYGLSSIDNFTEWHSDCYKPSPPSFFVSDIDSYNMAVDDFNRYVSEVKSYLECIRSEGDSDSEMLLKAVHDGVTNEENEIIDEVRDAKRELLMNNEFIQ